MLIILGFLLILPLGLLSLRALKESEKLRSDVLAAMILLAFIVGSFLLIWEFIKFYE